MVEKIDRLFLRANCFESGRVRASVDFDAVSSDDFRGKQEQELHVYTALSERAAKALLAKFGMDGEKVKMPLVQAFDGAVIEHSKNVIMHLRRNDMVKE